jgi:FkbM family methyltransferase
MVFNVADNLQRKFYYFPRLYWYYAASELHGYLAATLREGHAFLDIGANVGFFALTAARRVGPHGRVYAFEPDATVCESLERSAHANAFAQIRAFRLALSDRNDDDATLYRARWGTSTSLVPEAPGRQHRYRGEVCTRVCTLDALARERELTSHPIGAIKIDVEGEEPRTIAGMRATLANAGYPPIWCEVRGPRGSTRAPNTYAGVRDQLFPLGYRAFTWSRGKQRPLADADVLGRMDVLFEYERCVSNAA